LYLAIIALATTFARPYTYNSCVCNLGLSSACSHCIINSIRLYVVLFKIRPL